MRRVYAPPSGGRGESDSFESAVRFRLLAWSPVGAVLGLLFGALLRARTGAGLWVVIVAIFLGWLSAYLVPLLLLRGVGSAGSTLYAPSGRSTPRKREFSLAESYAVRGEYELAAGAYQVAIAEQPSDPEPYLRLARMYRDRVKEPGKSAAWFKRALSDATMSPGIRVRSQRELVELYVGRMGQPARAMPLLARIADEGPETSDGVWAAAELARIRKSVHAPDSPGPDADRS